MRLKQRRKPGACGCDRALRLFSSLARHYTADAKEYTFYLNVCGEIEAKVCRDKQAAVCQVKKAGGSTEVKVAGRFQNQTLRCVRSLHARSKRVVSVAVGPPRPAPPAPPAPVVAFLCLGLGRLPFVTKQLGVFPGLAASASVKTVCFIAYC